MDRRRFLIQSAIAGATIPSFGLLAAEETPHLEKLVILHTNDTHSRIEPFDSGEYKGLGGISARKTLIDDIRKNEKNVLLLDAGDIFQGTPYFNLFSGELEIKAMSMLGYDASTLGNHDFDLGIDNFVKQYQFASFPCINCNYEVSNTNLQGILRPYQIIKKGPIKIGILGLGINLDGFVPKENYANLIYLDPIREAEKIAKILKYDEKCDIIIALSHLGYAYPDKKTVSDIVLAESVDNIDIIIGGHTHSFLKCPKIVFKNEKKFVIINQVGYAGINLGRIEVYFNKEKNRIEKNESNLLKCQNDIK
jgi:5'-nucleotidase